jgi:dipeptidyl aminopeptidase/acylaminoacyl peptidase
MFFMKKLALVFLVSLLFKVGYYFFVINEQREADTGDKLLPVGGFNQYDNEGGPEPDTHPLSIEALRQGEYLGSDMVIEQTLGSGSNYQRYIASYKSEGLKIFGLLTVPIGKPTEGGWPVVIFNHGYISPSVYRTTERYVAYQDAFARNGYITYKSDSRGHGNSEGEARGGHIANDYTIDVLNALSSIQKYDGVNPQKVGMWGHSMGGSITLESMVVNDDIKAGVIWAGVVGTYEDVFEKWRRRHRDDDWPPEPGGHGWWRYELYQQYGEPDENPDFWDSLSATKYLEDISGPVQLHHGTADTSVDVELTRRLEQRLLEEGKEVEAFIYEGDDHNLGQNLNLALTRSVEFFDRYLKE